MFATARLLDLIREFDERSGWNTGFRTCAAWLCWRVGLDLGAARVRVARALGTLPQLAQALARGELSYAKVRALTRVATPETEERLLAVGRAGTAEHVERIVRGWRRVDRKEEARETARRHATRCLHVYQDEDGMVVVRGRLEPEAGAALMQALTAAARCSISSAASARRRPRCMHSTLPRKRRRWFSSRRTRSRCSPRRRSTTAWTPAQRTSGTRSWSMSMPPVGARTRTIPPALRRALHHRDRGCRFPGCGVRFGQGHHIRHWAHGGPTTLSNLAMLCRRHHRAVHEEGYQVARRPDGELRFRRPNGHVLLPDVPPPMAVPAEPSDALVAHHRANGVDIDARTSTPLWEGERLNLGYAIDVLHPLANPAAYLAGGE